MKIAIDVSPLQTGHKVRGVGFYLGHLKDALTKYFPDNNYVFFERGEKIPTDVDLVHFPYFEPFFLALPLYRRYKTVVTVHDLTPLVFPKAFPRGIKGEIKWQMQRFALRQANAIIVDSKSSKKDVIKFVGVRENKVHVVYLAAGEHFRKLSHDPESGNEGEIGNWKLEIEKRYGLPSKFILYVGDVTWNKNLPRLLDAVKQTNLSIVMAGKNLINENYDKNNPWNHDLTRVWELAKENKKIIRLGFIEDEDLVKIYNLATVFVMPSLYEGFGLPILEAMACGCPVITSKEGSLPEVAGEAAYYVDAYNVDNLVKGLLKVTSDEKLRKELSDKGLQQAARFSWKETADNTLKVFRQTLGI